MIIEYLLFIYYLICLNLLVTPTNFPVCLSIIILNYYINYDLLIYKYYFSSLSMFIWQRIIWCFIFVEMMIVKHSVLFFSSESLWSDMEII